MRILHIGKYYPPVWGGMESVLKNLADGLVASGHQVTVLCSNTSRERIEEYIDGVRVLRLPTFGVVASQPLTFSFFNEIRKLRREHDIVHFHSPNPLAEVVWLLQWNKIPSVLTHHSDIVRQEKLEKLYRPAFRNFIGSVQSVITSSPQAIENSPVISQVAAKCRVIPFGLKEQDFDLDPAGVDRVANLKKEFGRFLLFTGRLVGYKGLEFLLEALSQVREPVKLVIAGDGPLRERLQDLTVQWRLTDRIFFLGKVKSFRDLVAHYHACEFFVLPSVSRAEAFGVVLLEAMACGKPIITTELDSGVRSVNSPGECGLEVPPGDAAALAGAIRKLAADPGLCRKLGEGARKRFLERFLLSKMIESYVEIYQMVLDERGKAGLYSASERNSHEPHRL